MLSINNLQSLIQDWKINVVDFVVSSNDTDRLAEYALHLSRILAYPDLDVSSKLNELDLMGEELKQSIKKLLPLRPTQLIEKINNYLFKDKGFKANIQDYYFYFYDYNRKIILPSLSVPVSTKLPNYV